MSPRNVLILGAAGRDFHNFNVAYRNDPEKKVVAFTATQIPNIDGRRYPAELAGPLYPQGIPIHPEKDLETLIRDLEVHEVLFAYSDVTHNHVMSLASRAIACGADFQLLSATRTMIQSRVPVVSICAVRTGSGKSQTTRKVSQVLRAAGKRIVAVRHPMPYGDLVAQKVQRFETLADLDSHRCTIEEREEYEPHIMSGTVVYAGVDYEAILRQAEKEADVILWDGGNNDMPFYRPDVDIVVVDPHRPGHELLYYPGEVNFRRAKVLLINKVSTADPAGLETVRANIRRVNPGAVVIEADSPITSEDPAAFKGKRVLAIEDGPTLTHGEMKYGAATIAARDGGASEIVDPRQWAVGTIAEAFRAYPGIGAVLPAIGYGDQQIADLAETIRRVPCDLLAIGTPVDLRRIVKFDKPAVRVTYELAERGKPDLATVLAPLTGAGARPAR
jgi:predicted GTPase